MTAAPRTIATVSNFIEGLLRRIGSIVFRLCVAAAFVSLTASAAASSASSSSQVNAGPTAFRPVDASLLQALTVSPNGDVWIAPSRNGAQTSGTSERIVVFDPHRSEMAAFKIPRRAMDQPGFSPGIIALASDGPDVWLIEGGRATQVDGTYSILRFESSKLGYGPTSAVAAHDRSLWLGGAGLIERVDRADDSKTYRLTYAGNGPFGLASYGDDGIVFAIGHGLGTIRVDAAGKERMRYFNTGALSSPEGVVAASDGAIWSTDTRGSLLRVALDGSVERYRVPTFPSEPFGIALGPDGAIWFTEFFAGKIGRLDQRSGTIREFHIPYDESFPTAIAAGKNCLWFFDLNNNIGRVTTAGKITEYEVPAQSSVTY